MNLLAIVPCRMGDSEIPNKCTREDTPDGLSLLTKAMHFAHELTDYVLVTTPRQPPVMPLKRIYWRERPESLCGPDVPMRDVVNDALNWWTQQDMNWDRWVLLQPTTPTRTLAEVRQVLGVRHGVTGITCSVDVVPDDLAAPRQRFMDEDGQLTPACEAWREKGARQYNEKCYRRNGVAYVGAGRWTEHSIFYGVITDHHPTLDTQADWDAFVGFLPPLSQELLTQAVHTLNIERARLKA